MTLSPARAQFAVERRALGALGRELGKGGEATVYELPGYRVPELSDALAYKEYQALSGAREGLWKLVEKRLKLDDSRRKHLDEIAAWPCRVVIENDDIVGVLIPQVGASYAESVTLLGSGTKQSQLNQIMNLFIADELLRRLGRSVPSEEQRLRLCREFAGALAFYHDELGVVFGDISPNNEAYRLRPEPSVMFIDCDGARPIGDIGAAKQLNTPDWVPPEGDVLSPASDRYKLGLFILRCLSPGAGCSTLIEPARIGIPLDGTGMTMLANAVGADPRHRPSAREWHVHLSRFLGHPVEPPKVVSAGLDEEFVLRGRPCELTWTTVDALTVEVRHGGEVLSVDGRAGGGSLPIVLAETGYVHVRAVNDVGSDHVIIGPVAVVAPPEQVPVQVAMPEIQWPAADPPPMPADVTPAFPTLSDIPLPGTLTTVPPGESMRWPALPSVPCPIDVVKLMTDSPELDLATLHKGP